MSRAHRTYQTSTSRSRQAVCGTGFNGESRQWLRDAVASLGGRYCPHLIRHDCTHLVCHADECAHTYARDTTEKMQRAFEWQWHNQLPIQVRPDAPPAESVCVGGGHMERQFPPTLDRARGSKLTYKLTALATLLPPTKEWLALNAGMGSIYGSRGCVSPGLTALLSGGLKGEQGSGFDLEGVSRDVREIIQYRIDTVPSAFLLLKEGGVSTSAK